MTRTEQIESAALDAAGETTDGDLRSAEEALERFEVGIRGEQERGASLTPALLRDAAQKAELPLPERCWAELDALAPLTPAELATWLRVFVEEVQGIVEAAWDGEDDDWDEDEDENDEDDEDDEVD